jgi:hypothetical protein
VLINQASAAQCYTSAKEDGAEQPTEMCGPWLFQTNQKKIFGLQLKKFHHKAM